MGADPEPPLIAAARRAGVRDEMSDADATDHLDVLAVVGPQPRLRRWLERIGEKQGFTVLPLLTFEQVRSAPGYDLEELLEEARRDLDAVRADRRGDLGRSAVTGITAFWDFPSSAIAAILAAEHGLPTPGLKGTIPFEHKYWSRRIQQRVAPDDTPAFVALDVFAADVLDVPPLAYPFWLKPVKSRAGHLGFRVGSDAGYRQAIEELRANIHRLGVPFQSVLDRFDELPDEIARIGGTAAIAERILDGEQCTLEGFVHDGEVHVYGLFDIHRAEDRSTFTHYRYPSRLPQAARDQMETIATRLVKDVGYDHAAFNIEFFVAGDRTWILEVNPRISQEHSHLMDWVDGATNLQVMAQTALGRRPTLAAGEGPVAVAGKFFHRRWGGDEIVVEVPDARRIAAIERAHEPCVIEVLVRAGMRLSELAEQEPYSYLVAYVHLGGADDDQLRRRYEQVVHELGLRFAPVD